MAQFSLASGTQKEREAVFRAIPCPFYPLLSFLFRVLESKKKALIDAAHIPPTHPYPVSMKLQHPCGPFCARRNVGMVWIRTGFSQQRLGQLDRGKTLELSSLFAVQRE